MATFKIDNSHSEIQFKVKHMMISTVTGNFTTFDATLESSQDDFSDAVISFSADVNSINTGNDQRDAHLKSDDFFNAEKYPKLTFSSTKIIKVDEDKFELYGDITIRETTQSIKLNVIYGGTTVDPWGMTRSGFELTGKINRRDFGLLWSAVTETGGIVASDEVRLLVNVEMVKQG